MGTRPNATLTLSETSCVMPFAVPVTRIGKVPVGALDATVSVSTEMPGGVTGRAAAVQIPRPRRHAIAGIGIGRKPAVEEQRPADAEDVRSARVCDGRGVPCERNLREDGRVQVTVVPGEADRERVRTR